MFSLDFDVKFQIELKSPKDLFEIVIDILFENLKSSASEAFRLLAEVIFLTALSCTLCKFLIGQYS
jgi:hypothetical protein